VNAPRDTLSPAAAAARLWDVVVVGAGPAGSLAARQLAAAGARVLVVDRAVFPRDKVCGGCLGPRGLAVLRDEGLPAPPAPCRPVALARLRCGARELLLPLPPTVAVARAELDAALLAAAAQAGAELLLGARAAWDERGRDPTRRLRVTRAEGEHVLEARLVLAADGLGSGLLAEEAARTVRGSRVGAGALLPAGASPLPPGEVLLAIGREGYVGLVRLPDDRLDVAAALDPRAVAARGAATVMAALLDAAHEPAADALAGAALRLTPPLTRRARRPAAHRVLAIGDAAGFVEPFTGEGLSWALLSARAVAPLALAGARGWHDGIARDWVAAHRAQVRRRQRLCTGVAAWLRRPALVRATLALGSARPSLARFVTARLAAEGGA
jgi:flavin-dependent dehydrogenase